MSNKEKDQHGRRNSEDLIEQHPHQIDNYLVTPDQFTVTSHADAGRMKHPGHGQHSNSAQAKESLARNPNKSPMGAPRQKKHDVDTAAAPHTTFAKRDEASTDPRVPESQKRKQPLPASRMTEDHRKSKRGKK